MNIAVMEDALASIVYPGLAAVCVLWVSIGVARWMAVRRMLDLLLIWLATVAAATFILLSLSTGLFMLIPLVTLRLAIRLGWLVTLVLAVLATVEFLRQQHATYRSRQ